MFGLEQLVLVSYGKFIFSRPDLDGNKSEKTESDQIVTNRDKARLYLIMVA